MRMRANDDRSLVDQSPVDRLGKLVSPGIKTEVELVHPNFLTFLEK